MSESWKPRQSSTIPRTGGVGWGGRGGADGVVSVISTIPYLEDYSVQLARRARWPNCGQPRRLFELKQSLTYTADIPATFLSDYEIFKLDTFFNTYD